MSETTSKKLCYPAVLVIGAAAMVVAPYCIKKTQEHFPRFGKLLTDFYKGGTKESVKNL